MSTDTAPYGSTAIEGDIFTSRTSDLKKTSDYIDPYSLVKLGSFLPAIYLIHKQAIPVDEHIDVQEGIQIVHYLCHFGKIQGLRTVIEIFDADVNAVDFKKQTPLHFGTVSGEI